MTENRRCPPDEAHVLASPASTQYGSVEELERLLAEERGRFLTAIGWSQDLLDDARVDAVRIRFSGRKSPLQDFLKSLRNLRPESRRDAGARVNDLKTLIDTRLEAFLAEYERSAEDRRLAGERDDPTLPLPDVGLGARHPVARTMTEVVRALQRIGFTLIDGPEVDTDFYNFEALNQPADHPARDMHDTFFFTSEWLLRSHTSNVQVHGMLERGAPLRIICPGYVYRRDYDMTHLPTFRQIECLVVDKGINFGHMRYAINAFLGELFGHNVRTRFRSSYFPFVEPGAEMDIECQQCGGSGCRSCKGTGWMELGGCGVVNRDVFRACGLDPDVWQGFAFGFGLDRMAMNRFGVGDLRSFIEGDVNLLAQIRRTPGIR